MNDNFPSDSSIKALSRKQERQQKKKNKTEETSEKDKWDPKTWAMFKKFFPATMNAGNDCLQKLDIPQTYSFSDDPNQRLLHLGSPTAFDAKTLCAAIQKKCDFDNIKSYIQSYNDTPTFKAKLQKDGWPALYYAVERNDAKLLTMLLQQSIDPNTTHDDFSLPLLAYAIVHGGREFIDTTGVAKVLLAFGVSPKVIPYDMWINHLESPRDTALPDAPKDKAADWCTPSLRAVLVPSLHLSHRYFLRLANKLGHTTLRARQIAKENEMSELVKLPYFLVGQLPAARVTRGTVYSHVALRGRTPLVMAFSGPSGHGKTEMAKALGDLLSVNDLPVDCAKETTVWGLLGSTAGWSGYRDGSKLNNFLAENSGKRSVVFLDEFDKTEQDIREALLDCLQSGDYHDRRNNNAVDCSKTIWIIATNLGDDHIQDYYTKHIERLTEEKRDKAPFVGRINQIVPFLPFTPPECAVVCHKFLLNFATEIREPIDQTEGVKRLIGHCGLRVINDGKLCINMTNEYYNKDLGGRSLSNAVDDIKRQQVAEYSKLDGEIAEEINNGPLQMFNVRLIPVGDDQHEVGVFAEVEELQTDEEN